MLLTIVVFNMCECKFYDENILVHGLGGYTVHRTPPTGLIFFISIYMLNVYNHNNEMLLGFIVYILPRYVIFPIF